VFHPPDQPSRLPAGGENAIAYAIGVMADEWTLLIVRQALHGARRYLDWRGTLPISHAVLTSRLRRLGELGMLATVPYQDRPRRLEYLLTPRGFDIWPMLIAIWAWEPGQSIQDVQCGQICHPVLTCRGCGDAIKARDVAGEFGGSGTWRRSVPHATTRRRSRDSEPGLLPETTALVGNRWSAALLGAAFSGARRFGEFQERMCAPATMVSDRLRTFCAHGVLRPEVSGYRLTNKGRTFYPVVLTAIDWGQRWFHAPEGPAMVYRHRGHTFIPAFVCDRCAVPLVGTAVVIGPAHPVARATRRHSGTVPSP
jgi:DNA-binding HxlR family transcriptional regulator